MDYFVGLFLFAICAGAASVIYTKVKEKKQYKDKIEKIPELNIDLNNITDSEISHIELQELKKVYIEMIDLESKIDKTNQHLQDINSTLTLIAFFIIVPIVISIIASMLGYNIIQQVFGTL